MIDSLIGQMTLAEKIGQMTQVEKNSITPAHVTEFAIGSVLSGGGGNPLNNNPANWAAMVREFAEAALKTRLRIPLIYGADCVHGHNNMYGAVVFPHNIGLGATRDTALVEQIGYITAREMLAANVHWNFAPCLAVPQDVRWGRTYEGYASDTAIVGELGAAYVRGLQRGGAAACIKHYVGDGGAEWDTHVSVSWANFWEQNGGQWRIDQGDVNLDEPTFRAIHLAPYLQSLEAGALTVMASFSSWRGLKMHAHRYLLTDVLKGELGFSGFIVSDWMGINQLSPDSYTCIVQSINAGIDMVMVPYNYEQFIAGLTRAVENRDVKMERVDDAVRRILWVKQQLGLFDQPLTDPDLLDLVGSNTHRAVARDAVRKSLVLLKNENAALPITAETKHLLIAGQGADDLGLQSGGWTIEWQGVIGDCLPGTSLLKGLRERLGASVRIDYDVRANFPADRERAPLGIYVAAEFPYAEGVGDSDTLQLLPADLDGIRKLREHCDKLVLVLYSGRPLIITDIAPLCDAIVAAWLPGSEGEGVADVLCGDYPFSGKLPHPWVSSVDQLPLSKLKTSGEAPLFPYGAGL